MVTKNILINVVQPLGVICFFFSILLAGFLKGLASQCEQVVANAIFIEWDLNSGVYQRTKPRYSCLL